MRSVTFQFYIESLCRETFPLFKKIKYNIRCIFISNMRNLPAVSVRLKTMQFLSSGFKTNINVKFIKKYWKSSNTALTEDIKLSLDSHAITTCYSLYIILSKFFTPCHHSILFNFSRDSLLFEISPSEFLSLHTHKQPYPHILSQSWLTGGSPTFLFAPPLHQ